jgi:predicted transcriptional regulator
MKKIYQPNIIEIANMYIESLESDGFFNEYEIKSTEFARDMFCDHLTDKFILGEFENDNDDFFTDEEFEKILKMIVAGSILYEMKENGWVESYEDEDTEEVFFLTEKGKKELNEKK